MVSSVPMRDSADDAVQEYLDLLLKPASAVDTRPYANPLNTQTTRPLRMPLPPMAPPTVESPRKVAPPPVTVAPEVLAAQVAVKVPVAERSLDTALLEMAAAVVASAPAVVEPAVEPKPVLETVVLSQPIAAVETPQLEATPVGHSSGSTDSLQPAHWADSLQPAPWAENGRPQWAQQRFEVLLFTVGGLNLAVPLVELGAIHALDGRELTPIFGQIDWFLGMLPLKEGALRVIDTAKVVMPERYDEAMAQGYRYVITLSGSDWGLGVDTIHDSVQLEPDAVRWRSARSKRPWLAGTVVEQMCALLDASQLTWMFHNLDRHRGGTRSPRSIA